MRITNIEPFSVILIQKSITVRKRKWKCTDSLEKYTNSFGRLILTARWVIVYILLFLFLINNYYDFD